MIKYYRIGAKHPIVLLEVLPDEEADQPQERHLLMRRDKVPMIGYDTTYPLRKGPPNSHLPHVCFFKHVGWSRLIKKEGSGRKVHYNRNGLKVTKLSVMNTVLKNDFIVPYPRYLTSFNADECSIECSR